MLLSFVYVFIVVIGVSQRDRAPRLELVVAQFLSLAATCRGRRQNRRCDVAAATMSSSRPPQAASEASATTLSIPGKARLTRELQRLKTDPPPGIAAYLESDDNLSAWRAEIVGPPDSPFEDGVFELSIKFPSRYPMEPPNCRFTSRPAPFHPNIDANGRICLDTLKSPPAGTWSPAVSLSSLLLSLRSLLGEPNPDDGLVADISQQYRLHPEQWRTEAKKQTKLMMENKGGGDGGKRALEETSTEEKDDRGVEDSTDDRKRQKKEPSDGVQNT